MAVRINQEALNVFVKTISAAGTGLGKTKLNQEALLATVPASVTGLGKTKINQAAILLLTPVSLIGQRVQITGGPFQDASGNPLSNGYLVFRLQHDGVALFTGQIVGGAAVRVPLDINGYVQGTISGAPVLMWPNNVLLPAGGSYIVWAYDSSNRLVWDNPQVQTINSTPSPYSINVWIPGP